MKPCPFCGGLEIRYYASGIGRRFKCMDCHAEGPPAQCDIKGDSTHDTSRLRTEAAATMWNGRVMDMEDKSIKRLTARRDRIRTRLEDVSPYIAADQKHLKANTPEWAYWHHGYCMALSDVLRLCNASPTVGTEVTADEMPNWPTDADIERERVNATERQIHAAEKLPCTRCNDTGWLEPIEGRDGSYISSRPCPNCNH